MKCSRCGVTINDDILFCPLCQGKMIADDSVGPEALPETDYIDQPIELSEEEYYEEPQIYYDDKLPVYHREKDSSPALKTWVAVVAAVVLGFVVILVAALIVMGLGDKDADTAKEEHKCQICSALLDADKEHCDACVENYSCKMCNTVSKDVKNDFCPDCTIEYTCIHCDEVKDSVKEGYCKECALELACKNPGCDTIVEDGFYCDDCIANLLDEQSGKLCFWCEKSLKNNEIYLIDTYGIAYCEKCDTGKYCTKCNGYIEATSEDDVCLYCAEFVCFGCADVLESSEVSLTDSNNNYYCASCDTGRYCSGCGAPVKSNRDKCKSCGQ